MFYRSGTATFTHGSNIVTGVGTEWLTYVSKGAFIRKQDDIDYWVIQAIISDTELALTEPYLGDSTANYSYTITTDKTPNLGMPVINRFDSNPVDAINAALSIVDMAAGNILDYQNSKSAARSGEDVFFVRGDYSQNDFLVGRTIEFTNISGEISGYDVVQRNTLFEANISGTPVGPVVAYNGSLASGENDISEFDVIHNITRNNHAFIKTVDVPTNSITYSGEVIGTPGTWGDGDALRVYGKTKGLANIQSVDSTSVTLSVVSGEELVLTEFVAGELLYNYDRETYRNIYSRDSNVLSTPTTSDTWIVGDVVYTVQSRIQTRTNSVLSNISSVKSGARSQIGEKSIKQSHIDWGLGHNQVDASDIPSVVVGLDASDINSSLQEVVNDLTTHRTTGEAHDGSNIRYTNSETLLGPTLLSENVTGAINELKTYVGIQAICYGVVDEATNNTIIDETFLLYDPTFFSGEFYVRMESGGTRGQLRKVLSYNAGIAEFTLSGEVLTGVPVEGDQFSILRDDSWATREAFEEALGSDATGIILRATQVSATHSGLFTSGETLQEFVNFISAGTPTTANSTTVTEVGNLSGETAQDFFNQIGGRVIPRVPRVSNVLLRSVYTGYSSFFYVNPATFPTTYSGEMAYLTCPTDSFYNVQCYLSELNTDGVTNYWYILLNQDGSNLSRYPHADIENVPATISIYEDNLVGRPLIATGVDSVGFAPVSGEYVSIVPSGEFTATTAQGFADEVSGVLGQIKFSGFGPAVPMVGYYNAPWFSWIPSLVPPAVNTLSGEVVCFVNSSVLAHTGFYKTLDGPTEPPISILPLGHIDGSGYLLLVSGETGTVRLGKSIVSGDVLTAFSPTAFGFSTPS